MLSESENKSWMLCLQRRKRRVENFYDKIGVGLIDAHGRGETNRLSPQPTFADEQTHFARVFEHLSAFRFGRFFGLAIFHHFDTEHQTFAANVADDRIFRL